MERDATYPLNTCTTMKTETLVTHLQARTALSTYAAAMIFCMDLYRLSLMFGFPEQLNRLPRHLFI